MTIEQNIFQRAQVDFNQLANFGFEKTGDDWCYTKIFMNGNFKAVIRIDTNGNITGNVYETDSDEIYIPLRVESMAVGFAGSVRTEYEKILENIKAQCCHLNYFIHPQANRLTTEIYEKYGDKPIFPWNDFSGGVFKNPNNGKWYALIMNLDFAKLDKKRGGKVEVVNIKLNEDKILKLCKQKGFYPAYHMNKKNWISVVLDDTLKDDILFALLNESHTFTLGARAKNRNDTTEWLVPANPKFFDIEAAFEKDKEIIWKQSNNIRVDDIAYMYVGAPISAVLYKCKVTEVNIPYDYADKNLKITHVMKIKKLQKYAKDFMPFHRLKKLNVNAIRGPRICPQNVTEILK